MSYNDDDEIENQGSTIRFKKGNTPNLFLGAGDVSSDHLSVHRNQQSGISAFTKALAYVDDIPSVTPQVQSDWNETNTTSKAYILNKPTIPTNTSDLNNDSGFLTEHQDISEKANKNEMSVVPGTGVNIDKTTITLKQGMSATVLTTHQDINGKENAMPIATATGETLTAVVGNYYRLDNVGTLAITLPTIVGVTKLQAITFLIVCGVSALVTFVPQGTETILKQEGFVLEDNTTYEVTALWNGSEWTLSRVIY